MNSGNSLNPDPWRFSDLLQTVGIGLGDIDNDGDKDLICINDANHMGFRIFSCHAKIESSTLMYLSKVYVF